MKAIHIKYLKPTDFKGSRLKAFTDAGAITEGRDYSIDTEQQARELAARYCDKFGWNRPQGFGSLPNGDYVATLGA